MTLTMQEFEENRTRELRERQDLCNRVQAFVIGKPEVKQSLLLATTLDYDPLYSHRDDPAYRIVSVKNGTTLHPDEMLTESHVSSLINLGVTCTISKFRE